MSKAKASSAGVNAGDAEGAESASRLCEAAPVAGVRPDELAAQCDESLVLHAATIDELLSADFETVHAPPIGPDPAAGRLERRIEAWAKASTGGNAGLFERRLARDGLSLAQVRERLAGPRRKAYAPVPAWAADAAWIETALGDPATARRGDGKPSGQAACAFAELLEPAVAKADAIMRTDLAPRVLDRLTAGAQANLRDALLRDLSALCAPALYERFAKARSDAAARTGQAAEPGSTSLYDAFAGAMRVDGFRGLFASKPVLLRLIATLTRQWIDTTREFLIRLDADLPLIRRDLLGGAAVGKVERIDGDLSDPHNFGRSVRIITFADGARAGYKPRDVRVEAAWHALIDRLNRADPPLALRAVCTIPREDAAGHYGWSEFIAHEPCEDADGCRRFFRRAGAWLALFHVFAATDMHQENMIAAGDHPVPVDLETILQPSPEEHKSGERESEAFDAALDIIANSVMTVGLLPAYGRAVDNSVFAMGGLTADWGARTVIAWNDINSDAMRPAKTKEIGRRNTNLPHVGGRYAKLADHIDDFVAGFDEFANFLRCRISDATPAVLFDGFAGLPVRKVVRPTRFYYMLLQRLRNHKPMDDGATWSAQADFVARLAEWDKESEPLWPLLRAERAALLALNVPHFVTPSDGDVVADATGIAAKTAAMPGLQRALARAQSLDAREIAWQVEVIRENTNSVAKPAAPAMSAAIAPATLSPRAAKQTFLQEADEVAAELSRLAIRRGPGAAWIGLDWLGDSEVFQLVCLGPDLYNGTAGIALFLAAHAAVSRRESSGELARAALAHLRKNLRGRNAARFARALGTGGATGLGSIVYAFAVIARLLNDDALLADAHSAAGLFSDELIAADKQLDVIGGSAGGILGLLRLYRDTQSAETLACAIKCGEHLLSEPRTGSEGRRSWPVQGKTLNGMSHGAAGFAYALASLAAASGREDFASAAAECIAFEDASYDTVRHNWPDLRSDEPHWPCQWCHGAIGIGLSRLGLRKRGVSITAASDIDKTIAAVQHNRPTPLDTLCCGTLGGVEFLCEAGTALNRDDLRAAASHRLFAVIEGARTAGDYRWNSGQRQFNLGLFRGLSGVGYTLLRHALQAEPLSPRSSVRLPNVLIWE
jgi:type 2 lantibiotic biosynthesis protein LanM